MAAAKVDKEKKENKIEVSLGSIAGKIKRIRELKKMTQREVGLKCEFSEATADIRIIQYEKGQKIPREKSLAILAEALGVDETVLFDADLFDSNRMHHALFDIEDGHGLHPVEIDGKIYLEFGDADVAGNQLDQEEYHTFLRNWYEMYKKCRLVGAEDDDVVQEKSKEYALWKYMYSLINKE